MVAMSANEDLKSPTTVTAPEGQRLEHEALTQSFVKGVADGKEQQFNEETKHTDHLGR